MSGRPAMAVPKVGTVASEPRFNDGECTMANATKEAAPKVDPKAAAKEALEKANNAVETNATKAPRGKRKPIESWPNVYNTAAEAEAEAKRRSEGPKRAFKLTIGKAIPAGEYFTVAHNVHESFGSLAMQKFESKSEEIGKAPRSRAVGVSEADVEATKKAAADMTPEAKAALKKDIEERMKAMLEALK